MLAQLEAIRQVPIADCGHFVMVEKPAELARVVCEIISQSYTKEH